MKKAHRTKIFWFIVILFAVAPTALVVYLSAYKAGGGLTRAIAEEISRQANVHVSLGDVELPSLSFKRAILKRLVVHNPLDAGNPFLDADEIVVDGIHRSSKGAALRFDTITVRSYTISVPAGGAGGKSGDKVAKAAALMLKTFLQKGLVSHVILERGRLLLPPAVGEERLVGITGGEIRISDDGRGIVGRVGVDSFLGSEVVSNLTFTFSGSADAPSAFIELNTGKVSCSTFRPFLPNGYSLEGIFEAKFTYKAGGTGKDFIALESSLASPTFARDDTTAKASSAVLNARYESENSTFPDLESFPAAIAEMEPSALLSLNAGDLQARGAGFSLQAAECALDFSGSELLADLSSPAVRAGEAAFESPRLVVKLGKRKNGMLISTNEPLHGAALAWKDKRLQFLSLSAEGDWSSTGAALDLNGKLLTGGKLALSLSLDKPPALSGKLEATWEGIPVETFSPFLADVFPLLSFSGTPIRGDVEAFLRNGEPQRCRFALSTQSLSLSGPSLKTGPMRAAIAGTARFRGGGTLSFEDMLLDLGSIGSLSGAAVLRDGSLASAVLENAVLDSSAVLDMFRPALSPLPLAVSGKVRLSGMLQGGGAGSTVPARLSLDMEAADELSLDWRGRKVDAAVRGATGKLNLSAASSDGVLIVRADGTLLPRTVMLGGKRLLLSGRAVDLVSAVRYDSRSASLEIDKIRFESESGLVEEITGNVSSLFDDPIFSLRIKDWGLTLEQVMSVVEVPPNLRVTGGIFTLVRTLEGRWEELKSTYTLTVNGLTVVAKKLKLEGAGLILEFP